MSGRAVLRARDRGMTLIELLVAMLLLGITTSLLVALFASMSQTYTDQENRHDSMAQASLGMQRTGLALRAAAEVPQGSEAALPALSAASGSALTMHGYFDPGGSPLVPTRVSLALNGDRELVETRVVGRPSGEKWLFDAAPTRRVLARDVLAAGASTLEGAVPQLFTYRLADGRVVSRALSTDERLQVVAVDAVLTVRSTGDARARTAQIQRSIVLSNVEIPTEAE